MKFPDHHARRRRLGQHFLARGPALQRLVDAIAPASGEPMVEIGPGRGALTRPLLAAGVRLLAVELDERLVRRLKDETAGCGNLVLKWGDALDLEAEEMAEQLSCADGERLRVVGNLPYSVATPLITRLVTRTRHISSLVVMVQREVGERMLAAPGGRDYGALSVHVQLHASVTRLMRLSPGCFEPPPRVDSVVIRLDARIDASPDPQWLAGSRMARRAFIHRRKTLANSLQHEGLPGEEVRAALDRLGLAPAARPESLSPDDYVRLARALPAVPAP